MPRCRWCRGDGWVHDRTILVTKSDGPGPDDVRILEPAEAKALYGKLDPETQAIYELSKPCECLKPKRGAA